ncbi:MAG: UDP-2,3-diacylglucosamine diphosphatase [Deltaproteobacteria bacterium]
MRTIFLADAHLVSPADQNYRLLLQFLAELEGNTETLFIMGDLFDFWLGFSSNPFRQYDAVLVALQSLRQSGCRLVYFEGNHDFHMGDLFSKLLGAEIHTGPSIVNLQGKRLFLCHGDQINRADHGYRLLRLLLHNRLAEAAVTHFPLSLATFIKNRLQQTSRAGYQAKVACWDYRQIIIDFARLVKLQGCDGLVTGHFHLGFHEQLDNSSFNIISLGDWMEQFTFGEMVAGTCC